MELGYKNRKYLELIYAYYNKDESSKNYIVAVWDAYEANKKALNKYQAFFAELFEDELLADRRKILKCLRKNVPYELHITELWKKVLIRFPEIKDWEDTEIFDLRFGEVEHFVTLPYWHVKYQYELNGEVKSDALTICNLSVSEPDGEFVFCDIDKFFLQVFLIKTIETRNPFTCEYLYDELDPYENLLIKPRSSEDLEDEHIKNLREFELSLND